MAQKILLINGPNLNLLGVREPDIYGSKTLRDIEEECNELASKNGVELLCKQSNSEGELIDFIHDARKTVAAIVINPGAFSHTSIAIRDALSGSDLPIFEVHISNIHAREKFRHHSHLSAVAIGVICGFGTNGYRYAIEQACSHINNS